MIAVSSGCASDKAVGHILVAKKADADLIYAALQKRREVRRHRQGEVDRHRRPRNRVGCSAARRPASSSTEFQQAAEKAPLDSPTKPGQDAVRLSRDLRAQVAAGRRANPALAQGLQQAAFPACNDRLDRCREDQRSIRATGRGTAAAQNQARGRDPAEGARRQRRLARSTTTTCRPRSRPHRAGERARQGRGRRARSGRRRPLAARRARRARAITGAVRAHRAPSRRRRPRRRRHRVRTARRALRRGDDLDTVYGAIAVVRRRRGPRARRTSRTRFPAARTSPSAPSSCSARRGRRRSRSFPALSFADLAWARLGIDPMGGARVVDARAFAIDAAGFAGPMLLAQCDAQFVLSDVKLALLDGLGPDHDVDGAPAPRPARRARVHGRARRARPRRRARPPHVGVRRHRARSAVAAELARLRRARPNGCAGRAAARGTRSRRTTRCGATCSRRPTRWWRRSRSSRPTRPAATSPSARTTRSKTSSATCSSR